MTIFLIIYLSFVIAYIVKNILDAWFTRESLLVFYLLIYQVNLSVTLHQAYNENLILRNITQYGR